MVSASSKAARFSKLPYARVVDVVGGDVHVVDVVGGDGQRWLSRTHAPAQSTRNKIK